MMSRESSELFYRWRFPTGFRIGPTLTGSLFVADSYTVNYYYFSICIQYFHKAIFKYESENQVFREESPFETRHLLVSLHTHFLLSSRLNAL